MEPQQLEQPLLPARSPRSQPGGPASPDSPAPAGASSPGNSSSGRQGAKLVPALAAVALGAAVRLAPIPEGLDAQAWSLLALFVTLIGGLVLGPLPSGAWALLCASAGLAGGVLSFDTMFAASSNTVIWLVVISFFLARGFERTGLGERIAAHLLTACGRSSLGLALGLASAELLLTPAMPSTTSRAAGLFVPVITSVSRAAGSLPGDPSRHKLGVFLTQSQFQASAHSSNFVLTAAAQNLLCMQLAISAGVPISDPFLTWVTGSCVPAALGVLMAPCLLFWLWPPAIRETPEAPATAAARLRELGPLSRDEKLMAGAVLLAVVLWVFGGRVGVEPVTAAMLAVSVLLATGVLSWQECLACAPAWDTLLWFTVAISLSMGLQDRGVIGAFSDWAGSHLEALALPWPALFAALQLLFFAMHYLFASQTAHVAAIYPTFLALMLSSGVPPQLAAMSLAYTVNLFGSLTHYASGQAAVYGSAAGFLTSRDIFVQGAACSVAALALWGSVGMAWWHVLGWW